MQITCSAIDTILLLRYLERSLLFLPNTSA